MRQRPLFAAGASALTVGALVLAFGVLQGAGGGPADPALAPVSVSSSVLPGPTGAPAPTGSAPAPGSASSSAGAATAAPTGGPSDGDGVAMSTVAATGLRLSAPTMGLDLRLASGSVSSDGRIKPPAGIAMWVTGFGRVRPGQTGTAVVAGHVVYGGRPDVFASLNRLQPGDVVTVDDGGRPAQYRVRRAEVVDKQALTTDADVWGVNGSARRLVLVTCDDELGFRSDGHMKANFVVVAES